MIFFYDTKIYQLTELENGKLRYLLFSPVSPLFSQQRAFKHLYEDVIRACMLILSGKVLKIYLAGV
jgi:hypothetical protein